jgi:peptide/nickel transport system ATP-binding protein
MTGQGTGTGRCRRDTGSTADIPILEVNHLVMSYETQTGMVSAVDDVSFSLPRGRSLGLVGESGCGKTSIALTLMRLTAANARVFDGEVLLDGENLLELSEEEMRKRRWADVSMVFQGAMSSWNRCSRWGSRRRWTSIEPQTDGGRSPARIGELFDLVGIDADMVDCHPHELGA